MLLVAWQQEVRAVLAVADTVRTSSAAAVAELRALGLRPMLVTGDNATAARAVAAAVGIDAADVVACVLPEDKAAEVARLRAAGRVVAMFGDGVNDAPALAAAFPGDIAHHSRESVLGIRVQHRRNISRGRRNAESDDRRIGHGGIVRSRRREQPSPGTVRAS